MTALLSPELSSVCGVLKKRRLLSSPRARLIHLFFIPSLNTVTIGFIEVVGIVVIAATVATALFI